MKCLYSVFLLFFVLIGKGGAAGFPERPLSIVVPYAAGGATEAVVRSAAQIMATDLSKPVVVNNKPGASGIIGIVDVAKSKPDGHTMLYASSAGIILNPLLYADLRYSVGRDLRPVSLLANFPLIMAVSAEVPVQNLEELIGYAKTNPGKLNYASTGNGSTYHIAGEIFQSQVGVEMTHVPYSGGAPALQALMAGHVQVLFIVPSKSLIESERVKVLAVASSDRLEMMPDVPTFAEYGLLEFEPYMRLGLMVPSDTPDAAVERLVESVSVVLDNADFRKTFEALGYKIPSRASAQDFDDIIRSDIGYWGAAIKERGISLNQ